jgi:hypothetical protein
MIKIVRCQTNLVTERDTRAVAGARAAHEVELGD